MKDFEPIRILGIIEQSVGRPRNDGTPGSALYAVPFQLSETPPAGWAEIFPQEWDHPSSWTPRHRPGICRVSGNVFWLQGTTLEEVEKTHKATLKLALDETNRKYAEWLKARNARVEQLLSEEQAHKQHVGEVAKRIKFD